tara:strand:+ start:2449 stop:2583 length:135 start_codon:yes stop_codon:yes gene_type:complete
MPLVVGEKLDEPSDHSNQKDAAPESIYTPSGAKSAADEDYISYR